MGNSDLGVAFSRNQPAWQQRSQQLLKRLNVRGGEADSSLIAPLLAGGYADRIARRRRQEGRYQLANGMGAMLDADDALSRHEWLSRRYYCRAVLRRMRGFYWRCRSILMS